MPNTDRNPIASDALLTRSGWTVFCDDDRYTATWRYRTYIIIATNTQHNTSYIVPSAESSQIKCPQMFATTIDKGNSFNRAAIFLFPDVGRCRKHFGTLSMSSPWSKTLFWITIIIIILYYVSQHHRTISPGWKIHTRYLYPLSVPVWPLTLCQTNSGAPIGDVIVACGTASISRENHETAWPNHEPKIFYNWKTEQLGFLYP